MSPTLCGRNGREIDARPARPDAAQPQPPRLPLHLDTVGWCPQQLDLQPVVGEHLRDTAPPLDDGDRVLQRGVEVEVVELHGRLRRACRRAQTVGVDVHQRRPADQRGMHSRDHEGGRGDAAPHLQRRSESLGQRGLPGTEVTTEHHQVSWPQQTCEALTDRPGVVGCAGDDLHGPGHETLLAEPAVASPTRSSSAALTRSLCSRITMCPAPSHSTSRDPGTRLAILRLCPTEVSTSFVPVMMYVGTWPNRCKAWNLSCESKFGKNCASTSNDVDASMLSTNSTYDAGTPSPKANWSATRNAT